MEGHEALPWICVTIYHLIILAMPLATDYDGEAATVMYSRYTHKIKFGFSLLTKGLSLSRF